MPVKRFFLSAATLFIFITAISAASYAEDVILAPEPPAGDYIVRGSITWNDHDNNDGLRPYALEVKLMKDNEVIRTGRASVVNDWTYEFTDLPEPAAEMPYSTELGPVTGYEVTCSERETDNPRTIEYDFTAVHSRTFVSISGSILWDDDYDRDGIRPDSVTVDLTADRKTLESFTATAKDNWEFHFDRLEKYEDTREIPYHIEAGEIAGYEMKQGDFSVSYHHIPETKTIYFALHFDDRNNQDGTRPEKIRASLMNGIETVSEKELSADTGWNCSFTDIPMNENGKEIFYSVDIPAVRG